MCTEVRACDRECDTVAELRAAMPQGIVLPTDSEDTWCLCGVDLHETAAANGLQCRKAKESEGYPFPEYILEAAPLPERMK